MADVSWTDAVSAVGSITTPIAVVVLGVVVTRRQTRNGELLKARIEFYKDFAPDLNTLMCYLTFIGTWRDVSPVEIVALKRSMDHRFHSAAPLFSDPVLDAYTAFEHTCFATFGRWGADARIRSGAYRRREAWQREPGWDPAWDARFTKSDTEDIPGEELMEVRAAHDAVIAALVVDLDLTRARREYTTNLVSLNAHAPIRETIEQKAP